MNAFDLCYRQIHLDFHTSEHIAGIGSKFDPEVFASTLEKAHVNSVTCFARCHHGWVYYDTQAFPERRHPHLTRNLLKEQIEACHARDIRVPIYTTIQWDHFTANQHPEWLAITEDGRIQGTPPYQPGFYRWLCVNSPYMDFLKTHVQEILETLPVDGFFFDIVHPLDDSSIWTRRGMEAEGLDPSDSEARQVYGLQVFNTFIHEMSAFVHRFDPDCSIFYNSGHVGPRHRPVVDSYTHFEIESLPSGGWGYAHFPLSARYTRTLGNDFMGMTGKFHTSWGDFHSFKHPAALQFECFQMLAMAAKCSIGDQLHPQGEIDQTTYELIGSVYEAVEKKEPWCKGAKPVVDIGVLTPEEFTQERLPHAAVGVMQMLQEAGHQFNIIDSASDLSPYKVLILPDVIPTSNDLASKIEIYLEDGGSLIASYRSGLDPQGANFAFHALGVQFKREAPYSPDFIIPQGKIGVGLPRTEHVMYMKGLEVEPTSGSEILASTVIPYFNRTHEHFCSHRHTPSSGEVAYPAIVRRGRVIYFAHPIFTQYQQNAPHWCKTLVLNALNLLLPEPLIRHDGPSTLIVTLNEQPANMTENGTSRHVLHLLHYIPTRRGQDFDTIEDVLPVHNVNISVKTTYTVQSVALVPQRESLSFEQNGDYVNFVVPTIDGHQMILLE